ncbi:MAG: sulfatase-like hydrolase/transferase [Niastella sp.]|nr:sulfatase-like hydrolase/transferase [Niastella sp.]
MNPIFKNRFGPVFLVIILVISLSFITRVVLLVSSWSNIDFSFLNLLGIFFIGLFYDFITGLFFALPVALYCWLMKDAWYQKKWNRVPLFILFFIILLILVFNVGGEITFWNEFSTRYNFIAVDYLIYTTEVIGNIQESYNMPLILGAVLIGVIVLLYLVRKKITLSQTVSMRFALRSIYFLGFLALAAAGYFFVNNSFKNFSRNNYVNELSGNGVYEFGAAFWHNEIDYPSFYKTGNHEENFSIIRNLLQQPDARFTSNPLSIEREIVPGLPERKWNIVLISVESLSGSYLKYFGNTENITPYLDSLIPHSLFFKNFYATGTRTVRGLEALSLSIPPTPGQSIVRRPNNENMFTIGNLLKDKGYDTRFVYGGNSFFDNMGYYFSHNGYKVIDERDIPDVANKFKTAWGVADEFSFDLVINACDSSYKQNKPFFNHIMTVSNHRPYTYPDGRIDRPSKSKSIQGAVKYTDYSIHKFIQDAKSKPWFDSTVFIIVADHCARSAGKTELPLENYHIPCFIYAPALIPAKIEDRFTSQIDLLPTLLGLMNLHYKSKFMGFDIYNSPPQNSRVFISTYQKLGYFKNNDLVTLAPLKKTEMEQINPKNGDTKLVVADSNLIKEAIAWYQTASYLFNNNGYKKN